MITVKSIASRLLAPIVSPRVALAVGRPLYALAGRRERGQPPPLESLATVLVVRLDQVGDVVLTTPFLRELRRNAPQAWITLVVKPQTADIVEHCPYINEVLTLDRNGAGALRQHLRAFRLAPQRLWRRHFDVAILPRYEADYYHGTYLLYFSGARRRVAYSEKVSARKQALNSGFDGMLTDILPPDSAKHEVEHNLDVLRFLGGKVLDTRLEVWLEEEDRAFAKTLLGERGTGPWREVFGLAPGAGLAAKRWPVPRFAEVAKRLRGERNARFVVVGGPEDRPLGDQLEMELGAGVVNAAGRTTLRQAAALLERCRLTLGNDSGPMHLAAAVGCPVVEISWHAKEGDADSTESPARFGPWGVPHAVVRPEQLLAPCRSGCESDKPHCILGVQPKEVIEAAETLLQARACAEVHEL